MPAKDDPPRLVHGPYKRLWAEEVQDEATAVKQVLSGEVWGKTNQNGIEPAVAAYRGRLSDDQEGIEFWAFQAPDNEYGTRVYWRTPGEFVEVDGNLEVVKLKIAFVRITQALHSFAP
jgi:hypothetical protein